MPLIVQGFLSRTTRPLKIATTFCHSGTLRAIRPKPTLILDIQVIDECKADNTAFVVYQSLCGLLQNGVAYVKMPFSSSSFKAADTYHDAVKRLFSQLCRSGMLER